MKTRYKILCIVSGLLIGIGLYQMYSIYPLAAHTDLPFPFEHTRAVREYEGTEGYIFSYDPMYAAKDDPFWVLWSTGFYFGVAILIYCIIKKETRKLLVKITPWIGICIFGGFSLFLAYSAILYYVYIPFYVEDSPYVDVKIDRGIKPVYRSGAPLGVNVSIDGFGYRQGFTEFLILNEFGDIMWKKDSIPFGAPDLKHFSSGFTITDEPVVINGIGKYKIVIIYENSTVFEKGFLVE
ncbi:MAG: hypothetical protein ACREAU_04705 [Nitrosopumilaceae archaeon]